jgi:hypothetical protein
MTIFTIFGYHLAIVQYKCGWYIGYKYFRFDHNPPNKRVLRKPGQPIFISLGYFQIRFYPRVKRVKRYRYTWTPKSTGKKMYSRWTTDKKSVEAWVTYSNKEYPHMYHVLEEESDHEHN